MRYFFRREIMIRGALLSCLILSGRVFAQMEPQGQIEIFVDGKKYNSLNAYRQYQIDRLQDSTSPKKDSPSPTLDTLAIKDITQALVQNLAGPIFVKPDEKTMKKILKRIHNDTLLSKKEAVSGELTHQEKIKLAQWPLF